MGTMYREPIGRYITQNRSKLYVPKNGGLNDYVSELIGEIGIGSDGEFDRPHHSTGSLEIVPARGEDVGQRVEDCIARGESAYGLTGDDLFDAYQQATPNSRLGVLNTYDWFDPEAQFCRPALCLMNQNGAIPESPAAVTVAVNTKYLATAQRYLKDRFGKSRLTYRTVPYAGDTENTVAEGTHDWCIEIVYRGMKSAESAISRTSLQIVDVLRFSDISLIGRMTHNPWQEEYSRIVAVSKDPTGSNTSQLLADDNRICKKVGEETAEYVRAFTMDDGLPGEFNGVIYGLMVAAAKRGVCWTDIEADLESRWT
jgi:phosphoribosyl-ATP pyrophosphohydrolase